MKRERRGSKNAYHTILLDGQRHLAALFPLFICLEDLGDYLSDGMPPDVDPPAKFADCVINDGLAKMAASL
jgi:hypothetical protein